MDRGERTAYVTIVRKEVVRIFRIWSQTLLPSVITTSLYLLVFGKLIGSRLPLEQKVNYLQFISPGLILMAVITNSYGNTSASFFGAKFSRSIEELLVSPMSSHTLILGYLTGGVLRGVFVATLVSLVTYFIGGNLELRHPFWALVILLEVSLFFALLGFLNGLLAKDFDDINFIPTFFLTPLTYLGGIFYSMDMLPPWWQLLSHFNPVYYMISSFRYALIEAGEDTIMLTFIFLPLLLTLLYFASYYLVQKSSALRH